MTLRRPETILLFLTGLAFASLAFAAPARACKPCNNVATDANNCLLSLLDDSAATCLEYTATTTCPTAVDTGPKPPVTTEPFDLKCDAATKKVTLTVDRAKLTSLAGSKITVDVSGTKFEATVPSASAAPGTPGAPPAAEKEEVLPIDVEPAAPTGTPTAGAASGVRYIYVHENLAVDPSSAAFATESDRIVIRFIARKALLCRFHAASDDKNEYKPEIGRVGGRDGLAAVLKNWKVVGAGDADAESCGYPLDAIPNEQGRYKIRDGEGAKLGHVDFTFGPFTSSQLKFHLFRHDRGFKGNDLEAQVDIANHQRYVGWIDLVVVGTMLSEPHHEISVVRENGTELRRISVDDVRQQIDLVAQVKFFGVCSGEGNGWFQPQNLNVANACLGIGSGFSLTHPTERFYPLGINATLGRYLSLNLMSVLERTERLAPGYAAGDVFSGGADDVPTEERVVFGGGLGIGLDPTLLGDLVGQIVKAGF